MILEPIPMIHYSLNRHEEMHEATQKSRRLSATDKPAKGVNRSENITSVQISSKLAGWWYKIAQTFHSNQSLPKVEGNGITVFDCC